MSTSVCICLIYIGQQDDMVGHYEDNTFENNRYLKPEQREEVRLGHGGYLWTEYRKTMLCYH